MKLKFINLNLWSVGGMFNRALNFLIQEKADLITLQEVYDGRGTKLAAGFRGLNLLKSGLDLPYCSFAPALTDNRPEGKIVQGNAIFSRWPIISSKTIFFDVPYNDNYIAAPDNYFYVPRNLQQLKIKAGKINLNIFNTQAIWGLDGNDTERRLKMSEKIVSQIKNKVNVILAGDFNVNEGTQAILNIEKHLSNVFKNERPTSFNMKQKSQPGYATAVVDFVFTSKAIKVIRHQSPLVDVSDHLPLICLLEI